MPSGASAMIADQPLADQQAERAAEHRQPQPFPPPTIARSIAARAANRHADRIVAMRSDTRVSIKARHVRAGDQQQHADGAEQHPDRLARGTDLMVEERHDRDVVLRPD